MKETVLQLLQHHREAAIVISIALGILISIAGLLPSFFLTAANIVFFGFGYGMLISWAGEAIGAIVAFALYRRGFKKILATRLNAFPRLRKLVDSNGREAFMLIIALRLLPLVPSGLVTFAAALGRVSAVIFFVASSVGKIPALFIEGYAVVAAGAASWPLRISMIVIAALILLLVMRGKRRKQDANEMPPH